MNSSELISDFENKLEAQIKNAFSKELYDEDDDFYIAADYETKLRIEKVVKKLDLSVYGMSITESEFTVTFEFVGSYFGIQNKPFSCKVVWENNGEYDFSLSKSDLDKKWWLSIKNIEFNTHQVSEETIKEVIRQMNEALLITALKN
jgi:hypothetical protein